MGSALAIVMLSPARVKLMPLPFTKRTSVPVSLFSVIGLLVPVKDRLVVPAAVERNVSLDRVNPVPTVIAPKSPSASAPTMRVGVSVVRSDILASPVTVNVRTEVVSPTAKLLVVGL